MTTQERTLREIEPTLQRRLLLCAAIGLLGALSQRGFGATLNVPSAQYPTIQAAVNAASNGDIIKLRNGTHYPTATVDTIGKAITISGDIDPAGLPASTIDGRGLIRVLSCTSGEGLQTRFENLEIINGFASVDGGGMRTIASSPMLVNCIFRNNVAVSAGAGMHNYASSPSLRHCTFDGNSAGWAGGGMYNDTSGAKLTDCTFRNNTAVDGGGMHNVFFTGVVTRCAFGNNGATNGGGIYTRNDPGSPKIKQCHFRKNRADFGGAMVTWASTVEIRNCTFIDNWASFSGGGVENLSGLVHPSFFACEFTGNAAGLAGGGMSHPNNSTSSVRRCVFKGNSAPIGGGLFCELSYLLLQDCLFERNGAEVGAGLYSRNCATTANRCTFTHNIAVSHGGGVFDEVQSLSSFDTCLFANNSAGLDGGGMFSDGTSQARTSNCTFTRNISGARGGGMFCDQGNANQILGCTVTSNSAGSSGGGIYFASNFTASLGNTHFCNNFPNHTAGLYQDLLGNTFCP